MCTTAVDFAAADPEAAEILSECSQIMRKNFAAAYQRDQQKGLAPKSRDPEAFGEMASALYFSTGIQARMGRSREELICALRKTVDCLKHQLEP